MDFTPKGPWHGNIDVGGSICAPEKSIAGNAATDIGSVAASTGGAAAIPFQNTPLLSDGTPYSGTLCRSENS